MPFSNQKLEGFENKIAALSPRTSARRRQLHLVGTAAGLHPQHDERDARGRALRLRDRRARQATTWSARRRPTTAPPMSSSIRRARASPSKSLDDPVLKKLKIGVHLLGDDYTNPPPVHELASAASSTTSSASARSTRRRTRRARSSTRWRAARIDVAIVWGPIAGYFAAQAARAAGAGARCRQARATCRLPSTSSMGVKKGDEALKARVDKVRRERSAEIAGILKEYGVPLVDGGRKHSK